MNQYLRRHAEPEAASAWHMPTALHWSHVLVIPACNESTGLLRSPPPCDGRSLLILVINQPPAAADETRENNRTLADAVQRKSELVWKSPGSKEGLAHTSQLKLFSDVTAERDVLLVDRFSPGWELPLKGGVGHARKIGADLAAALIDRGSIASSWIHCSDGDVELPETYFTCVSRQGPDEAFCAALVYPFRHVASADGETDAAVLQATRLYELSLRYYRAGLGFAGSPYAFHTIGSTMAVNALHYTKVRGFPKRNAGEDFYLLNKLAKVGTVQELEASANCRPIRIGARRSNRVPFGTGAAVGQMLERGEPLDHHRFYHPAVFHLLKTWLESFDRVWESRDSGFHESVPRVHLDGPEGPKAHSALLDTLDDLGAGQAFQHAFAQSADLPQFRRQMHTWFDAFRTLKLVHGLRERTFTSLSYRQLLAHPMVEELIRTDPEFGLFEALSRKGNGYND